MKLRSRLRNEALVMLAELKLHKRVEYKQNDAAKARLKRHIAGASRTSHSPGPKARRPRQLLMQATVPSTPSPSQQQSGSGSRPEILRRRKQMTLWCHQLALLKKTIWNHIQAPETTLRLAVSRIKLSELFDFTVGYCPKMAESTGSRGLQDELEFYELLDMDASGEQDTDVAVDGMSEAVLMSN
ncbi:hypothetical protein F5888DRAFT_1907416 [Russula emetica]|nr:hypothetical protein F5888DRAFT_1907416 [Russula emetica]